MNEVVEVIVSDTSLTEDTSWRDSTKDGTSPRDNISEDMVMEKAKSEVASSLTAPTLRVEKIKDHETGCLIYTSEEDAGSQFDISDEGSTGRNSPYQSRQKDVPDFVPPTEEIRDKIIMQVEFYFSDANVLKDAFLLKHIRRNKMGYVSIKLITSFKKVKTFTRDYRVVAHSLRHSENLEVNEEGTKVRRLEALPDYDETTPSRTVVAVNMPLENPTIESVAELFSSSGDVVLIRILKPGKTVPPDIKKHANKHPEIGTAICAIIEFEKHEHAKKCAEVMTDSRDWRNGMRVLVLAIKKKKDKDEEKCDGSNEDTGDEHRRQKKRGGRKKKFRIDELAKANDSSNYSSGSEGETSYAAKGSSLSPRTPEFDSNRLSPVTTPKSSPRSSPRNSPLSHHRKLGHGKSPLAGDMKYSPRSSPEMGRRDSGGSGGTPSSPWVKRRLQAAQQMKENGTSPAGSPRLARRNVDGMVSPKMLDMTNVIRQPHGPDGSKGFYGGIGRGKPRSHTVS